jgi:hypothetical protein
MAERPGNDPGPIPAGPKLREAKQITWLIRQFKMSLVGFDHVFATAQPVQLAPRNGPGGDATDEK